MEGNKALMAIALLVVIFAGAIYVGSQLGWLVQAPVEQVQVNPILGTLSIATVA